MFRDYFKNNQDLPNKHAPNTTVSPGKPFNRSSSYLPFRHQNFTEETIIFIW